MRRIALVVMTVFLLAACGPGEKPAANLGDIKVGALFPLSGGQASAGTDVLHGVELAVDVLNGKYPSIDLPRLTVGKIVLVPADTQGSTETGASDVERLVTNDKVVAVTGAYQSAVTQTASQRAERLGVPFVNGSSSSTALTERGLKWFFRTGPSDLTFGETYFAWLKTIAAQHPVRKAVIVHTNDQFGNDGARVISELAGKNGVTISDDIAFPTGTADLSSHVQKLRSNAPDAVFVLIYTPDAIVFTRTMALLGYTPPAVLAFGAGYSDPRFITTVGSKVADYSITRAAWANEIGQKNPLAKAVAEEFQRKYNQPMTENSARDFTAMMTIGMAIQAAQSADPEKIRAALKAVNTTKTIMPWKGVRFSDKGQNELASGVIEQLKGDYHVLYPAEVATTTVVWPMPPLTGR